MVQARRTYRLTGTVVAESALAVTRPGETFASPPGSQLRLTKKAGRLPRLGPLREDAAPYFPATTLRGAIRRAARTMIRRAVLKKTGNATPWSVDTHYMLTQGLDTTNKVIDEKNQGLVGNEESLRKDNPFLSLFGRWKLPGHLGVDNAIPETLGCLYVEGRGTRSNDFVRDPGQAQFLTADDAQRLKRMIEQDGLAAIESADIDAQIKELRKEIRSLKDPDEKGEVQEQIRALEEQRNSVKAAKEGSREVIQRPLEGFEAILPGTRMKHRMLLQNADQIELGLMLASLKEFARSPYVGGHRSLYCGEISASWQVSYWPEDGEPVIAGEIKLSADGFEIVDEHNEKLLSGASKAWDRVVGSEDFPLRFERYLLVE